MAWEHREGQGALFDNKRKTSEKSADLSGEIMIDGVVYWLSGWRKVSQAGNRYLSLSAKKKEDPPAQTTNINPTNDEILF